MKLKHPKHRHSVILMFLIFAFAITAFAHPGRTDGKGGHYDRQNGGYHYHHGYDEHQHPNGVCPYENEDSYYMQDDDYASDNKKDKSFSGFSSIISVLLVIVLGAIIVFALLMSGGFLLTLSYKSIDFMRITLSLKHLRYIKKFTCVILCLILAVFVILPALIALPIIFREQIAEVLTYVLDKNYKETLALTIILSCSPFLTFVLIFPSYISHVFKLKTEPIDLSENEILTFLHLIWFAIHSTEIDKNKENNFNNKIIIEIIEKHFTKFRF